MTGITGSRCGVLLAVGAALLASVLAPPLPRATAVPAVPLDSCANPDNGAPVVDSLSLSTGRIDVRTEGRSITVDSVLHDTGGPGAPVGVKGATVQASLDDTSRSAQMHLVSGDLWRGVLRFPRGSRPGIWTIGVAPHDSHGLYPGYFGSEAPASPTADVVVLSREDAKAPTVAAVRMWPHVIDTRSSARRVRIAVDSRDGLAGVAEVRFSLTRRGTAVFVQSDDVRLRRVRGTARAGLWRGHVDLPWRARRGQWDATLTVTERVGHVRLYTSPDSAVPLAGLRTIRVRNDVDREPPVAAALTSSPSAIDIRTTAAQVTIEARVRDAGSGVAAVTARVLRGGISEYFVPMRLVEGSRVDGLWRGSWTAATCQVAPGVRTVLVDARDRASNKKEPVLGTGPSFEVVNADHVGPWTFGGSITADSITVDFSEDVAGISATSVLVLAPDHGPSVSPTAGHWNCYNTAGESVDCYLGPVHRGVFAPNAPFPLLYQRLVINPEHVLDVTDLAGNPSVATVVTVGYPPRR